MIRLRQIEININEKEEQIRAKCAKKLKITKNQIEKIRIVKKSIDARHKNNIVYCYEVDVKVPKEDLILKKNKSKDIFKTPKEEYQFPRTRAMKMNYRPVIIGSGPAGLFTAYMLAKYGYQPLIIERGENIESRIQTVEKFWEEGILDVESNVQFGEGGAGTFSDGKLNTLVKDNECRNKKVLEIFVEAGAPEEILYLKKPHIGTDLLRKVIINLRNKIIQMGGEIRYHSCLTNIRVQNSKIQAIEINGQEEMKVDVLVLAIGHSARDTFRMLNQNKIPMTPKPFAVGVRVQHSQKEMNIAQYGNSQEKLPPATYKLTYQATNGRGVYSFCMCPGGYVVNSSSQKNSLAINGMSYYQRDSKNANSAIVVTVTPKDFEEKLFGGLEFQEELEKKAYQVGNGKIPLQLLGDFMRNQKSTEIKTIEPILKGQYELANLQEILPDFIIQSLKEAFPNFEKKIKGFANPDILLAAIETRTSSPVRILRTEDGQSPIRGIYPAGEGAGYAGGIMSAAIDGIKVAENIAKNLKEIGSEKKELE